MEAQDEDAGDADAVRAFQGRMTDIVARAVAAEREACAKVAAEFIQRSDYMCDRRLYGAETGDAIARAIRDRSTLSK